MKILKIRDNKLKLSLTSEEAAHYGLNSKHTASAKELRDILIRIFAERREKFSIEEKILVEAYPKLDGSYDIFVSHIDTGKSTLIPTLHKTSTFWGFERIEHLAFALHVLFLSEERAARSSLCEREERRDSPNAQNSLRNDDERPLLSREYQSALFDTDDLFSGTLGKSESDRRARLLEHLGNCRIYQSEEREGVSSYILEVRTEEGKNHAFLCEFAKELSSFGTDILTEHTRELSLGDIARL